MPKIMIGKEAFDFDDDLDVLSQWKCINNRNIPCFSTNDNHCVI